MAAKFPAKPEHETTNVVPFKPFGRSAADDSLFDTQGLLAGSRDRLAHGAATAFAEHLADAADNLLALADRATSTVTQDRYSAARWLLARRGQELLQQFRLEFVSACDAAFLALDRPNIQPAATQVSELRLVAEEDFERDLTIGRLSSRADYNCSQQLTALDRRIAALRQGRRITQTNNPLYPKSVFTAFLAACRAEEAGDQVDLALLQEFGNQISDALPKVYDEINRYLAENNVLPSLPIGAAPPADLPTASQAGTVAEGGYAIPEDVFAQIANRLLASQPLTQPVPASWSDLASAPTYAPAQVMEALTLLQRGIVDTQRCPGVDPRQADAAAGDLLRSLRATPLITWSDPLDAITVDVVAMLFELILDDRDLPDALRAQVGRLQIPILKVAMMDKGFFSHRQHPARRLLDTIAGAATGWKEEDLPRLIDKVRAVIEAVLDGFEQDTEVLSSQLAVLEQFLADEEKRGTETASKLQGEAEREERRTLVRQVVSVQIQRHTTRRDLPEVIRDFLERFWHIVLLKTYLRSGEAGQGWQDAVATMEDLVWSVIPKTGAEERRRLIEMLPGLLNRLRSGLASVDMEDEWDGFFARLVHLHMAAVHPDQGAGDRPATAGGQGQTGRTTQAAPTPPAAPAATAANPERPVPGPKPARDERYLELARGLDVGAWIEFRSTRGTRRALRLNWCSEQRGAYLFSNLQGDETLIVATTSLAEQLRNGSARILSRDSCTERAVSQLWTTVAGNPAPDSTA